MKVNDLIGVLKGEFAICNSQGEWIFRSWENKFSEYREYETFTVKNVKIESDGGMKLFALYI